MLVTAAAWILLVLHRVCGSVLLEYSLDSTDIQVLGRLDEVQHTCSLLKHMRVQVVIEFIHYQLLSSFYLPLVPLAWFQDLVLDLIVHFPAR